MQELLLHLMRQMQEKFKWPVQVQIEMPDVHIFKLTWRLFYEANLDHPKIISWSHTFVFETFEETYIGADSLVLLFLKAEEELSQKLAELEKK